MKRNAQQTIFLILTLVLLSIGCTKQENSVEQDPIMPKAITLSICQIQLESAVAEGLIPDNGTIVTARGFVWSLQPTPTLANHCCVEGEGTGRFTSLITSLQPEQTYYARAYATNSVGTAYGPEVTFTTPKGQVTDIDGNQYPYIAIGDQLWMTENLRVTRYTNGDEIPTGLPNTEWEEARFGAYAVYPHHLVDGLDSEDAVAEAYGLLYNWFAAADPRGVCPTGWSVPSWDDWKAINPLSGGNQAGGVLKSTRTEPLDHPRWAHPNERGSTSNGWAGMPGGLRLWNGDYSGIGTQGHWLIATEHDSLHSRSKYMHHLNTVLGDNYSIKQIAYSIRCLKNAAE